ncbi:hypothetical protein [Novosphingobium sp. LASN5T]|uniref:hypothetical protein n=1 Tax=Novosphingobium sp. LASN5T TaxID=2491021 RepID=UPI000F5D66C5|nr:hypothetical protein [Novosphingobium sp. LASN5T]RQW43486.1 hypothetical protein EH199_12865 [Novosphingobium sp. LASN5T]
MKKAWLIAISLFGAVCALPLTGDPRVVLTDWSPPLGTISYIELASRFAPWKISALGLSCGSDRQLRLVLRSRLPGPRWVFQKDNTDEATIVIGDIAHELVVPMTLTETGVVDTLISERLSPSQLQLLSANLGTAEPQAVNVFTMETGTFMKARASNSAVRKVISACT